MKTKQTSRWVLLLLAIFVGSTFELKLMRGDAHAIIGRPLTPFSYAGVARRTTRRAVAYGAVAQPYAYPAPAPYAPPQSPYPYYW